ncbi:MAG: hypothetical protein K2P92_08415 [Bdellovibrionaceae bacterium]|nr:hypothetical protein [Pseudobdellovibrionaceae bacterium]
MKKLILISAMALGLIGVGCSKTSSNSNSNNNVTATPPPVVIDPNAPTDGSGSGGTGSGNTVAFKPANMEAMRQYVLPGAPYVALNNPTDIKISLNLEQSASGRYGGYITISYMDNGVQSTGILTAGSGRNPTIKGGYDNDRLQADYNYWFTFENQLVFTGFFEDQFGSITIALTPDEPIGGGNDAEPLTVPYKGSIYFKNFKNTSGQFVVKNQPYRPCWFIYNGVFDCRSNVIQTKCGLEPGVDAGYTLLGTFTNVDIKKAFNIK